MSSTQLRVMVIGAHPDDCEITSAGTAVKFIRAGHRVKFVYVTNGNAGHHEAGGGPLALRRAEEVRRGCAVAGIEYEIMDNNDGYLEVNLKTRDKLIRTIREYNPDILITHRINDYHPDHRNTAVLVQDSSYLITVPNICPLVPIMKKAPVILYMHDNFKKPWEFTADAVVDIDDTFEDKIKMLHCHESQFYEWLPWNANAIDKVPKEEPERYKWLFDRFSLRSRNIADKYRDKLLNLYGVEKGAAVRHAEAFEISEYGYMPEPEELSALFSFGVEV
jgi:N-acetylglucosamine malate deacetylase 1